MTTVVPVPNTRQGGQRRWADDSIIVTNVASGAYNGGAAVTAEARIDIPSARLMVGLSLGYQPLNGSESVALPVSGATAWTGTLTAWKRLKSGLLVPSNVISASLVAPFTWEAVTTVDQWRLTLTIPNAPGTGVAAGILHAIGTWEPAPGAEMPDEELAKIFQACKLSTRGAASSTTGT